MEQSSVKDIEVTQISNEKKVEEPENPNTKRYTIDFNEKDKRAYCNLGYILRTYGVPSNYVEVGVAEGSTITEFAIAIKDFDKVTTKLYAIDPFIKSDYLDEDPSIIQNRFIHNLFVCPNKNIEYFTKPSQVALKELIDRKLQPELIYIDGSHDPDVVITDLIMSWELLKLGGIILVNDITTWPNFKEKCPDYSKTTPTTIVNNFIQSNRNKIKNVLLPDMRQTAFMKVDG